MNIITEDSDSEGEAVSCTNCSGFNMAAFHPCEKCGTRQCMSCRWPYEWYFCRVCARRYCQNCIRTAQDMCADCESMDRDVGE